jgi:hypothetical protein
MTLALIQLSHAGSASSAWMTNVSSIGCAFTNRQTSPGRNYSGPRSLGWTRGSSTEPLKRHKPLTTWKNVNDDYHGCLCVSVRRSGELNLRIAGWFDDIAVAASTLVGGSGVV